MTPPDLSERTGIALAGKLEMGNSWIFEISQLPSLLQLRILPSKSDLALDVTKGIVPAAGFFGTSDARDRRPPCTSHVRRFALPVIRWIRLCESLASWNLAK